MTDIW